VGIKWQDVLFQNLARMVYNYGGFDSRSTLLANDLEFSLGTQVSSRCDSMTLIPLSGVLNEA